jgi:hypothetical protein
LGFHGAADCHRKKKKKKHKRKTSMKSKWFYLVQDYIDSMKGATLSGTGKLQTSPFICDAGVESQGHTKAANVTDELSLV